MASRMAERITKRYMILSLLLLLLLGTVMMGIVAPFFSKHANGYPYLETKLFYTPGDLLAMVEGYGEEARALYVRISLSLDALLPLLAANLLTSFSLFLTRALQCLEKWRNPLFALGIATCASDWMENLMMILLLRTYPQQHMALAVMGRLMTSVKYLLTASFAVAILREAYLIRKKRPTVA